MTDQDNQIPGNGRFIMSTEELILFLDAGVSTSQIAEYFGITERAVRKRIAKLKAAEKEAMLIKTTADGKRVLDTPEQFTVINKLALEGLLDKKYNMPTKIQLMNRIEKQNEFQLRYCQIMYTINAIQSFQETVLEVLDEVDPSLRAEVLKRLREKKRLRAALNPT